MSSLKEVKTRINSVKSTRKITNAMKMVASSKLHHAQKAIMNMRPYEEHLASIMKRFMSASEGEVETAYSAVREPKKVALLVITSNSSLCGAFNANVIKEFSKTADEYKHNGVDVEVFPIGKKAAQAAKKAGFKYESDNADLLDHPGYNGARDIAENFMQRFKNEDIDKVEIISHHFVSSSKQVLQRQQFLPVNLESDNSSDGNDANSAKGEYQLDYIVEPSANSIITTLVPASLHLKIFTAILDSLASEHAARMMAMQIATDNADELIDQLTLTYNKTRQQAITSELLDIAGGSSLQQ